MERRWRRRALVALIAIVGSAVAARGWYRGHLGAPMGEFNVLERQLALLIGSGFDDPVSHAKELPSMSEGEAKLHRIPQRIVLKFENGFAVYTFPGGRVQKVPLVQHK